MKYFGQELFEICRVDERRPDRSGLPRRPGAFAANRPRTNGHRRGARGRRSRRDRRAELQLRLDAGGRRRLPEHLRAGRPHAGGQARRDLDVQRVPARADAARRWPTTSSRSSSPVANRRCSARCRPNRRMRESAPACRVRRIGRQGAPAAPHRHRQAVQVLTNSRRHLRAPEGGVGGFPSCGRD